MALLFLILLSTPRAVLSQQADPMALPFRRQPVDYFGPETDEAVGRLQRRLERGEARLEFDERQGFLPALLKVLDVPVESQMLVFTKNSVNARLISPENPRALYFNDEIYVGWVPGALALEISAVDPGKGAVFYSLGQSPDRPARLERQESCLLCHASSNSLSVPGHLLRSFLTDSRGNPTHGYSRVTDATPLANRWGGWYVTGEWGDQPHWGNLPDSSDRHDYEREPNGPGRTTNLSDRCDVLKYRVPHSDIVSLLVHDHQTHVHNLLTRVNYEDRLECWSAAQGDGADSSTFNSPPTIISPTEEQLVRALLFADAAPLAHPVRGSSGFAEWFSRKGPRDAHGRSLRQFDLRTRLFEYRLSYLIYSRSFDSLPERVKGRVYRRLGDVLAADVPPAPYAAIPQAERDAIIEILRETKADLPEFWKHQ